MTRGCHSEGVSEANDWRIQASVWGLAKFFPTIEYFAFFLFWIRLKRLRAFLDSSLRSASLRSVQNDKRTLSFWRSEYEKDAPPVILKEWASANDWRIQASVWEFAKIFQTIGYFAFSLFRIWLKRYRAFLDSSLHSASLRSVQNDKRTLSFWRSERQRTTEESTKNVILKE